MPRKTWHLFCTGELEKDRFIPPRRLMNLNHSRFLLSDNEKSSKKAEKESILYQNVNELHFNIFRAQLAKAFDLRGNSILPFFDEEKKARKPAREQMWPVHSRPKPCIKSAIAILDLPNLNESFFMNNIDWGSSNYIAASLAHHVYLWHAPTHETSQINLAACGTAVKWSPNGSELAIGKKFKHIEMYDMLSQRITRKTCCSCRSNSCYVSAINWHPFTSFLITGCTNGVITVLSRDFCQQSMIERVHLKPIISLEFSCDGTYFASSSADGYFSVFIFEDCLSIPCIVLREFLESPVRGIAWHPWEPFLLCAASVEGVMQLWNVKQQKLIIESIPKAKVGFKHYIFNLCFNKVSAELVTSHVIEKDNDRHWSEMQVNVLSSFEKVVDRMDGHVGSVLYLAWSPDGTQLATAGLDESLQLWQFLPKKEQNDNFIRRSISNCSQRSQFSNNNLFLIR